jgi:hypothetical protein
MELSLLSLSMWSNQEPIRTGSLDAHLGIGPPKFGGMLLQKRYIEQRKVAGNIDGFGKDDVTKLPRPGGLDLA